MLADQNQEFRNEVLNILVRSNRSKWPDQAAQPSIFNVYACKLRSKSQMRVGFASLSHGLESFLNARQCHKAMDLTHFEMQSNLFVIFYRRLSDRLA